MADKIKEEKNTEMLQDELIASIRPSAIFRSPFADQNEVNNAILDAEAKTVKTSSKEKATDKKEQLYEDIKADSRPPTPPSLPPARPRSSIDENIVAYLIRTLQTGDRAQQHDAAKAIGYLGKSGALTSDQRIRLKTTINEIFQANPPSIGIAFAMMEALERVDPDAFWTLVMGWYGAFIKNPT